LRAHTEVTPAFEPAYLRRLKRAIHSSPYFTTNTLNRDFVGTKGFSIVFRREGQAEVERTFPFVVPYLERVLRPDCNAFYLNPLELGQGSRVDPHVDRSLRSYCKEVPPPLCVSVLYVEVHPAMTGGVLVLARGRRHLARIQPQTNTLVTFEGDLTHGIERVESPGERLSLVCEQYLLTEAELSAIPSFAVETRARGYE
jgi:hypothetical protein